MAGSHSLKRSKLSRKSECSDLLGVRLISENESALLYRRLCRVLRGFKKESAPRLFPVSGIDYDIEDIRDQILNALNLNSRYIDSGDNMQSAYDLALFKRIKSIIENTVGIIADNIAESSEDAALHDLTELAILFLTLISHAILEDCGKMEGSRIYAKLIDDRIILYINPVLSMNELPPMSIRAIILARTVGAELYPSCDDDGMPCFKIEVSRHGEYLYEIRRKIIMLKQELNLACD